MDTQSLSILSRSRQRVYLLGTAQVFPSPGRHAGSALVIHTGTGGRHTGFVAANTGSTPSDCHGPRRGWAHRAETQRP